MMSLTSPVSCASGVFLISYFVLYLLSLDESDLINDESDKLGSDSRPSGK